MRKMHCPEGHTFDGQKFNSCPVCAGAILPAEPAPTPEEDEKFAEAAAQVSETIKENNENPAQYEQEAAGGQGTPEIEDHGEDCPDDAPEPEIPIRERKIKALLGTISELEATESDKKVSNSEFNSKITMLKESIISLSRDIRDLDHLAPLPLFDSNSAVATRAMGNPKVAEDHPVEWWDCDGHEFPGCLGPDDEPKCSKEECESRHCHRMTPEETKTADDSILPATITPAPDTDPETGD